ncbi:MAG TPA: 30S ribosomal protein S27ae [Candidatus Nanoarchaeia archaeon]|nr:30S ribosomal protein S27ae [Candidatus Nanoarchaeia archaeon]
MAADKKPAAKSSAPKRKPGKKLSALYTISGEKAARKNKFCPKCGQGTFMGVHSNRVVCGKCHYVEFVKRM